MSKPKGTIIYVMSENGHRNLEQVLLDITMLTFSGIQVNKDYINSMNDKIHKCFRKVIIHDADLKDF